MVQRYSPDLLFIAYALRLQDDQDTDSEWTPPLPRKRYESRTNLQTDSSFIIDLTDTSDESESNIDSTQCSLQIPTRRPNTSFICMVCLVEEEIYQSTQLTCKLCGITVHTICYQESLTLEYPNITWLCEPCTEGLALPQCELCPKNEPIPIRRTTNGLWAHLVCSRYTHAIYPGDEVNYTMDQLKGNSWGRKACMLCSDDTNKWVGVCCKCDAGFCKNYCHATCAQQAGLLYLARDMQPLTQNIEKEEVDPFYFYCTTHSIKELLGTRSRAWNTATNRTTSISSLHSPLSLNFTSSHNNSLSNTISPLCKVERFLQFSPSATRLFKSKLQEYP